MMEWAKPGSGRLDAKTKAMGDLRPVRFNTPAPWLMTLAPWLPWQEDPADPAHRTKLLDYAPFAAVMWSFFLQEDSIAANEVPMCQHILAPSECCDVLRVFEANGFTHDGSSFATLTIAIQTYATQQQFRESFLDSSKHLESIDPGPTNTHPDKQFAYIREVSVRELSDESSKSYGPMALVELYAAPRLTVASRFKKTMSFVHILRTAQRALVKYDDDVKDRIDEGEDIHDKPMQETLMELFVDFFRTSAMPISMVAIPMGKYDEKCKQRSALFGAMVSWRFVPTTRDATMAKYFTTMVGSYTEVASVTLPAPSSSVARVSTEQLATALGATGPITESLLASINSKLQVQQLTAQVTLPEHKDKPGTTKLAMVISKIPTGSSSMGLSISTPSHSTGGKDVHVTAELQAWLNSREVIEIESALTTCLATSPPSYNAAVAAVARSRMPLIMQMLTTRNHIGKLEALKRGKELRAKLRSVMAFFVSAHEDTSTTPPSLVQHDRLLTYDKFMPKVLMDVAYGSSKGDFHLLDPLTVSTSVEQRRNRRAAPTTVSPATTKWSSVENNMAAAEYLDRYFHLLGFDNGVFSSFIKRPNAILTANKSLPEHEMTVLRVAVTDAVIVGLNDLGKEWLTAITTDSHLCPFPHGGISLSGLDGVCYKELDYIQQRLDKLDDDTFWEGPVAKPSGRPTGSAGTTASQEVARLKQEVAGVLPCLCDVWHASL